MYCTPVPSDLLGDDSIKEHCYPVSVLKLAFDLKCKN